jgi:2-oxoglutarate dehydrogenase E1 component
MQVCNFTTPAQLFHALRRQLKRDFRKPLVIMSPKSLLRHPLAVSTLDDFSKASFQEVIDDVEMNASAKASAKKVLLCSGKVYYDLVTARTASKRNDVAIIRIEQLYPWPAAKLSAILAQYKAAKKIVWVQEEPRNMGAWTYIFSQWAGGYDNFQDQVGGRAIQYVGREIGASPAVGSPKVHESEQKALLEKALAE